jgi:hypothetical protein
MHVEKTLLIVRQKRSAQISQKERKNTFHADVRRLKTQMDAEDFIVITRKSKGKTDLFVIVTRNSL